MLRMDGQPPTPPICAEPCCCAPGTGLTGTDWVVIRCKYGSEKVFYTSICEEAGVPWVECLGAPFPPWDSGAELQPANWLGKMSSDSCTWIHVHAPGTEPIGHDHCCSPLDVVAEGGYGYSGGGLSSSWCQDGWFNSFSGFHPLSKLTLPSGFQVPAGTAYLACFSAWQWCIPDLLWHPEQSSIPLLGGCNPDILRNCGKNLLGGVPWGFDQVVYYFAFFEAQPDCDYLKTNWTTMYFRIHDTYLHYRDPVTGLHTMCRSAIPMGNPFRELEFKFDAPV